MADEREIIKNLEEALKVVDNSNLPPAPSTDRPFPTSGPVIPRRSPPSSAPVQSGRFNPPAGRSSSIPKNLPRSVQKAMNESLLSDDEDVIKAKKSEKELDIGSPDFKMKFDFESAYRDVPEDKPIRLRREKRTGLVGGVLLAVFVICVSITLACP